MKVKKGKTFKCNLATNAAQKNNIVRVRNEFYEQFEFTKLAEFRHFTETSFYSLFSEIKHTLNKTVKRLFCSQKELNQILNLLS